MSDGPLNLSPNFEARFSRIDITPTGKSRSTAAEQPSSQTLPRSPRKKYPSHIFPNEPKSKPPSSLVPPTPSKSPLLSTARRAESRTKSNRVLSNPSTAPTRTRSISKPKSRISSSSSSTDPANRSFSFMRETTSSSKKQVEDPPIGSAARRNISGNVSHVSSENKRPNRVISKLQPGRRITSNTTKPIPFDITNFRYDNVNKRQLSDNLQHVQNKQQTQHSQQLHTQNAVHNTHLHIQQQSQLLPLQLNRQETLAPPYIPRLPALRSQNFLNSSGPIGNTSNNDIGDSKSSPVNTSGGGDVYNRLYNNSYKRKVSTPRKDTPKVLHRSTSNFNITSLAKVNTLSELYSAIDQQDPHLFDNGIENEQYITSPSLTAEDSRDIDADPNSSLTIYERGEILRRKDIYYLSQARNTSIERSINIKNYGENFGFDDKQGNYVVIPHDHINYRYEIQKVLGNGSFGNVVNCTDHKYRTKNSGKNKTVAIKIIKNDLNWSLQAVYEIKMLKHLNETEENCPNLLKYFGHFHFRGHMCIVTEVLSLNLFTLLEISSYKGFALNLIKQFSVQILKGLDYIHKQNIIHCDIKPENIMIKLPPHSNLSEQENLLSFTIKIIDFGSSCFKNEISYSYIQSRYYRAPEVVLGAKYAEKIDIWSFGCVISELFTGTPLLAGKNELEQIGLILELFGAPNSNLIQNYRKTLLNSVERDSKKSASRLTDPISESVPILPKIDEKSIKKTLLFTLFDLEGKINLQFLNLRLQALSQKPHNISPGNHQSQQLSKKNIKLNSKILEVLLKLNTNNENKKDNVNFIKFLNYIFQWDPNVRLSASELLDSLFLTFDN